MASLIEIEKMENLIGAMQNTDTGIAFKSQKLFLTTIPAAFSGADLIGWLSSFLSIDEVIEATHVASSLLLHGYIYSVTDYKSSIVKDDPLTFYRFQAPYYWISKLPKPNAVDYAIYLVKRTLRKRQQHGLEDYEHEALTSLQSILRSRWEFIRMQAADQLRLFKEKRKGDQVVLEAQERAFWRLHQPHPNKLCRFETRLPRNFSFVEGKTSPYRRQNLSSVKSGRPENFGTQNISKAPCGKYFENLLTVSSNRSPCDWFLTGRSETNTPWLVGPQDFEPSICSPIVGLPTSDSLLSCTPIGSSLFPSSIPNSCSKSLEYVEPSWKFFVTIPRQVPTVNQVKLWATGIDNLLWDPSGCQAFKFLLMKEFSVENLRFWLAVNAYEFGPLSSLKTACSKIYDEFLAQNSASEINIDGKTLISTVDAMTNPSRSTFDDAKNHIYKLMKSDSYVRFLRSNVYLSVMRIALEHQKGRTTGRRAISMTTQPEEISRSLKNSDSSAFSRQNTIVSTLKVHQ